MVRVVDASVAIKWFIKEENSKRALDLLREILTEPDCYAVPELFFFETVHVINRMLPAANEDIRALLDTVLILPLKRFSMTPELAHRTREMQQLGLSGYDGAYLALAVTVGGKWITCDAKAHARVKHLGYSELL